MGRSAFLVFWPFKRVLQCMWTFIHSHTLAQTKVPRAHQKQTHTQKQQPLIWDTVNCSKAHTERRSQGSKHQPSDKWMTSWAKAPLKQRKSTTKRVTRRELYERGLEPQMRKRSSRERVWQQRTVHHLMPTKTGNARKLVHDLKGTIPATTPRV